MRAIPSLRTSRTAAPGCPRPVLERALQLLPETDFVNAYGLTETSSTVALLGPDDHRLAMYSDDPVWTRACRRSGARCRGSRCGSSTRRRRRRHDSPGEIQVRGEQVCGEYVGAESKTDADGWLHTGDRGWVDVDGYLFVEGRADDTIIRGGENIAPPRSRTRCSPTTRSRPRRGRAARRGVGRAHRRRDHAAPRRRRDRHEHVREWVRERLGSLKTPEMIEIRDELPQTATGKILRRQVRTELAATARTDLRQLRAIRRLLTPVRS